MVLAPRHSESVLRMSVGYSCVFKWFYFVLVAVVVHPVNAFMRVLGKCEPGFSSDVRVAMLLMHALCDVRVTSDVCEVPSAL